MSWPLSHDFNEAIQNPRLVFADADLKASQPVIGARGLPLPRSGNFADVYQLRGANGRDWAVKCFTRPVVGLAERYAKVTEALARARFPFTVEFTFLAEGIRVGDAWRPVVKMDWVEGLLLNQVVRENAGKPTVLAAFLQMWSRLCRRLREAGIAHADLQHGNVLLVPGSRPGAYGLKLIDYDGLYVPALANRPSGEVGHPSYQHPTRASDHIYSIDVDRFPHLVVATALKGLEVVGAGLWDRHDTGDNLLFTEEDFRNPAGSKLMKELWLTAHPAVQALVGRLAVASGKPIPQTPWLDQIAPDGEPSPLSDEERRAAAQALGVALPVPVALPPEPAVALPLPAMPLPAMPLPEAADNLSFETSNTTKPAPRKRTQEKSSSTRPLLLAGAAFLVMGGILTAILLSLGKSRSNDTAGGSDEQPPPPGPKPVAGGTYEIAPMPRERGDVPPGPGGNGGNTAGGQNPKHFDPIVLRPVGKLQVKERWTHELGADRLLANLVPGADSRTAVGHGAPKFAAITLDLANGKNLPELPAHAADPYQPAIPLADGRFATVQQRANREVVIADSRTGRTAETLTLPALPVGRAHRTIVSPNAAYTAVTTFGGNQPLPFRVESTADKKTILELELLLPKVFFTADSSRLLVVESTGKGRWFKLPAGEPDGEWTLPERPGANQSFILPGLSADGNVLLYSGAVVDHPGMFHLIDARNGTVIRSFTGNLLPGRGGLSADGRLVVAQRFDAGRFASALVFESATGNVVAELSAPPGNEQLIPTIVPDGSAVIAVVFRKGEEGQTAICFDLLRDGTSSPSPRAPGDARWSAGVPAGRVYDALFVDPASDLVAIGVSQGGTGVFDLQTGQPRAGFGELAASGVATFFRVDRGRFASVAPNGQEITLWDARTGKSAGTISIPEIAPGAGHAKFIRTALSPNAQYLAVARCGPPVTDNPDVPLRVFDTVTEKPLLSIDWKGGSIHFTADSSRMLVAEWTGRFRWFKLPSGEADGGWELGPPPPGRRHSIHGISADGSVIAYNGPAERKDQTPCPALMDGKSGKLIRSWADHLSVSELSLAEGGRRVALMREMTTESCTIEVLTAPGGEVLKRVTVVSGRFVPLFKLAPDGRSLIVFNPSQNAVIRYDVPDAPMSR